jgi:hypothetical protein
VVGVGGPKRPSGTTPFEAIPSSSAARLSDFRDRSRGPAGAIHRRYREQLRPAAETAVSLPGLAVQEADAFASSRGFHLVRISPTADGPYPMQRTFNLDVKRIVAIVDAEMVSEVKVG